MDFNYGPPPPPPSKSTNNKYNSSKTNSLNFRKFSNYQNSLLEPNKMKPYHDSPNNFLDLPTHLPNEDAPVIESSTIDEEIDTEEPQVEHDDSKPIYIPGTSITLQTEEDIAKWIEERKKKWPTKKNIELKQLQMQKDHSLNQQKQKQIQTQQQELHETDDDPENDRKRKSSEKFDLGNNKKPKVICKFYKQNRHCKFGNKCKNLHESIMEENHSKSHYTKVINDVSVLIPKLYTNRQGTGLFKNLVQRDQSENENSLILDFIQFLDQKRLINHNVKVKK